MSNKLEIDMSSRSAGSFFVHVLFEGEIKMTHDADLLGVETRVWYFYIADCEYPYYGIRQSEAGFVECSAAELPAACLTNLAGIEFEQIFALPYSRGEDPLPGIVFCLHEFLLLEHATLFPG